MGSARGSREGLCPRGSREGLRPRGADATPATSSIAQGRVGRRRENGSLRWQRNPLREIGVVKKEKKGKKRLFAPRGAGGGGEGAPHGPTRARCDAGRSLVSTSARAAPTGTCAPGRRALSGQGRL